MNNSDGQILAFFFNGMTSIIRFSGCLWLLVQLWYRLFASLKHKVPSRMKNFTNHFTRKSSPQYLKRPIIRQSKPSVKFDVKTARYCRRKNLTEQKKAMEPVPLSRRSIGILKKETMKMEKKNKSHVTFATVSQPVINFMSLVLESDCNPSLGFC